jgi:hypothetical protein
MTRLLSAFLLSLALFAPTTVFAALSMATGTFAISAGMGSQSVSDANCVQPKVVIAYWNRATADATFGADESFGIGVAVDRATDQKSNIAVHNNDGVGTTDAIRVKRTSDFIYNLANSGPAANVIAQMSSFDATGFTINKTTEDGTNRNIIHYVCLGGSDITDAYLGEFGITTTTGDKAFTGVGFQGNLAFFFGMLTATAGDTSAGRIENFIGVANDTQDAAMAFYSQNGTTPADDSKSYITAANSIVYHDYGIGACCQILGTLKSFDSDGFTVNIGTNTTASTRQMFALILKGTFQSHIGQQARRTTNGTQNVTTPNFQPVGVIIAGTQATVTATATSEAHISFGAGASTTTENSVWTSDSSNATTTDTNMYSSGSNIYVHADNPSTLAGVAALSGLTSTGYDLNWTTTDANARLFWHLALGSAVSTRRPSPPLLLQ